MDAVLFFELHRREIFMAGNGEPFWEKAYREENAVAFSSEPNRTIKEFEYLLKKPSRILDVGCGEGQNAFYLAQQGYGEVDAFDRSISAIEKCKKRSLATNTKIHAFVADLKNYQWRQSCDWILSFGTFHFVEKTDWKSFILQAKTHTNQGGIHIVQIFTDALPAPEDISPFSIGLAKDGEIRELYRDWEILQFQSYLFEEEHPGIPRHTHASNKIVARKTDCV